MPRPREMLRSIETTTRSDVALGRLAIGGLLGENRVRVYADARIEGLATLIPQMQLAAPEKAPGAARLVGSGGPLRPGLPAALPCTLLLPAAGQVAARAA